MRKMLLSNRQRSERGGGFRRRGERGGAHLRVEGGGTREVDGGGPRVVCRSTSILGGGKGEREVEVDLGLLGGDEEEMKRK